MNQSSLSLVTGETVVPLEAIFFFMRVPALDNVW